MDQCFIFVYLCICLYETCTSVCKLCVQIVCTMNNYYYSKDGIVVTAIQDARRQLSNGLYPIKIRVSYQRERAYYPTGKSLSVADWEKLTTSRQQSVISARKDIENSFELVRNAVEELAYRGFFSIAMLNVRLKAKAITSLSDAIAAKIEAQKEEGRVGNSMIYTTLSKSVMRFAGKSVKFEEVTPEWLKRFERFLRGEGKKQSTIAIAMRGLRSVFNDSIRRMEVKESLYPFGKGKYEIQEGSGRKLALPIDAIGKIARYESEFAARLKYRDYWMFLYLCNGINVTDLVKLRYDDIVDGEIRFIRQKTMRTSKVQQEIRVVLSEDMRRIIDNLGNLNRNGYIFPVLTGDETPLQAKLKTQYFTRAINKNMAIIAEELGLPRVSTYTARHSFATVLKRAGVSIAYISESLGHNSLTTTEHYLASFEREEREKNAKFLTNF